MSKQSNHPEKPDSSQSDLRDIVKGTPEGAEAIQKALVGAARDQEDIRTQAELDEILGQAFYIEDGEYIGSYQEDTPIGFDIKQALLDWHNKQVVQAELGILNHLLRVDEAGDEPSAHLIRLRAIQMQGSAQRRLSKGRPRRVK